MTLHSQSIKVNRLISIKRDRIFKAFSSADALSQWFKPSADILVEVLAFEFVVGGAYRLNYTMPNGSKLTVGGVFEVIDEPNQIALTWRWEAPDPHADIDTLVSIQLIARGDATEVFLTHDKLPEKARIRHVEGWEATLELLEPFCILLTNKHRDHRDNRS